LPEWASRIGKDEMARFLVKAWWVGAALTAFTTSASSQTYPAQPIRLIVPFAAGGGSDILARIVSEPLAKRLGQPILVENRPGGGATLGADMVAKAPPDGYTWLFTTAGPQITNPYLMPKLPYDAFKDSHRSRCWRSRSTCWSSRPACPPVASAS
jgi:tripartite-type tricarboxylate transporter receptor subunit TctC